MLHRKGCYRCMHVIAGREGQARSVAGDKKVLRQNALQVLISVSRALHVLDKHENGLCRATARPEANLR